ncbi:MAG: hypothetical protein LBT41_04060, partial [Candidatus Methanoplasma sp.]|nr:hypothetical protein [Candidatus Methanoplasma sp.]
MKKNVVQFRLFVIILAAVTALAFATPLVGAGLVSAAGETHYVSSADDLDRIGRGTVGPDSATWDLDDVYVQTADITFGPGDDFNGGIQIRAAVNVSGSTAAVTVEYWNGTAFVQATSGSVLLAGSQTPVNIAAGTATISSFDGSVNNAIAVYGTIGGNLTAVVVEIPEGVASVAVEE